MFRVILALAKGATLAALETNYFNLLSGYGAKYIRGTA